MHPVGDLVLQYLQVVRLGTHLLRVELIDRHDALTKIGRVSDIGDILSGFLQDQMAGGFPSERLIWVLELESDVVGRLCLQEDVLVFEGCNLVALLLVKENTEEHFEVSGSDADVGEDVRVVASLAGE